MKNQNFEEAARLRDLEKKLAQRFGNCKTRMGIESAGEIIYDVAEEDCAAVVSMMTNIPVQRVAQSESEKLLKMEDGLRSYGRRAG